MKSRRKFLSGVTTVFGASFLGPLFGLRKAQAATWNKLKLGSGPRGVYAWGGNDCGQLGDNTTVSKCTPILVCGLDTGNVISVAAGPNFAFALLSNGTIMSWGNNDGGQLGDNSTTARSTPVAVCGISTAIAVNAGSENGYALLANGTIMAWGWNDSGTVGDGTTTNRSTPVAVCGISTATNIFFNGGYNGYALLANGTVMSWGDNYYGNLGNNTSGGSSCTPVAVCGITNAVNIGSGLAILSDGRIMSWGGNFFGEMADNSGSSRSTPVAVCCIPNGVSAMKNFGGSLFLTANGTVWAAGQAGHGALGNNTTNPNKSTPVQVCNITNAVAINASQDTMIALLANGTLVSWGDNTCGRLGQNSTTMRSTPRTVCVISGAYASVARLKSTRPGRQPQLLAGSGDACFYLFLHLG